MLPARGFAAPQANFKPRPLAVNNFFQQNFQEHLRFRYFQSYPRHPAPPRYPARGPGLLHQQQHQQQKHPQTSFPPVHLQQLPPNRKPEQQKSVSRISEVQQKKNRNVIRCLQSDQKIETINELQIKEELVDTLVESMEPTVPRFNTNKTLTHKLPSMTHKLPSLTHKLPSLPPLYSKEVLRKNPVSNVVTRPDGAADTKSDKQVHTSLHQIPAMNITASRNDVLNVVQHSPGDHLMNSIPN